MSQLKLHIQNPVSLKFSWFEPNKKRDKDNIASAKKFILDALVKCNILKNDGWKEIESFEDVFFIDKDNPRVEVDILEMK